MKKFLLSFALLTMTACIVTSSAQARTHNRHHRYHNHYVYVKKNKHTKNFRVSNQQPVKVEVRKCHFLFWDVECSTNTQTQQTVTTTKISARNRNSNWDNNQPITFWDSRKINFAAAENMIGLNARRDRYYLKQKFTQTFGRTVDPARIPWCAAWANLVLAENGIQGTNSLLARSFENWGRPISNPSQGDLVVLRRGRNRIQGHVGFFYAFIERDGVKYVGLLGGNQGHEVKISYYPISKVIAYRTAA
jgi:uncharacterized protein (TIGR02594 family)